MVSIIKNQLLKHLSRFTKNLSADKINLSAFKGEGELTNLELNEIVLTDLLELPSWLRLTSAWCNKVSFRIQWTKLKSVPIHLSLDEVSITVETCEELRSMSSQAGLSSYAAVPGKYSFIHKVIDGITVTVNTVNITFNSPAFTASVQISRILVESKNPHWEKSDLRMTRLKEPEKGQLLIFKELEWQTVRIEAKSTKDKNLTPLRLLTNQARCRITIKKRLSDCFIMGSRLVVILDDLLWIFTDSQLKAALHFLDSLAGLVQKATQVTRKAKAARKLEELPEYQAHLAQQARAQQGASTITKMFARYDVIETSYHFLSEQIILHLCDDPGPGRSSHPNLKDGAALQICVQRFQVDYYPYHLAKGERKHWPKYHEASIPHPHWQEQALSSFRTRFLDLIGYNKIQHTPLTRASKGNKEQGDFGNTSPEQIKRPQNPSDVKDFVVKELAKMMTACVILRIRDFVLYRVTGKKQGLKEFICGDRDRMALPDDTSIVHAEFIYFYYPSEIPFPLPPPKFYVQVNPIQIFFDADSCLWFNSFALNLHQSLLASKQQELAGSNLTYIDVKVELILPMIIFESTLEYHNQRDRPKSLNFQVTRATVTNVRSLEHSSRADLAKCVDSFHMGSLFFGSDFPSQPSDFYIITQKFLDHISTNDNIRPIPSTLDTTSINTLVSQFNKELLWIEAKDVWCIDLDPVWGDFVGAKALGNTKGVPLLDSIPITIWLHSNLDPNSTIKIREDGPKNADIHALAYISNLVSVQINHYQYLFLLRLAEEVTELATFITLDTNRILKSEGSGSLIVGALIPQLEVTFVMPSHYPGKESSGEDVGSCVPESSSPVTIGSNIQPVVCTPDGESWLPPASKSQFPKDKDLVPNGLGSPISEMSCSSSVDFGQEELKSGKNAPQPFTFQSNINAGFSTMKKGFSSLVTSMENAIKPNVDDASDTTSIRSDASSDSDNFLVVNLDEGPDRISQPIDSMFQVPKLQSSSIAAVEVASEVLEEEMTITTTSDPSLTSSFKRKDLVSVSTFKLNKIEFIQQSVGYSSCIKVQVGNITNDDCTSIPWDEFQTKFSSRGRAWADNPASDSTTPRVKLRMDHEFIPCDTLHLDLSDKSILRKLFTDFVNIRVRDLNLDLPMSTVVGLTDLIEDEIIVAPIPLQLSLENVHLHLNEDRPPSNITSPGPIPIDLGIVQLFISRKEDGIFHIMPLGSSLPNSISTASDFHEANSTLQQSCKELKIENEELKRRLTAFERVSDENHVLRRSKEETEVLRSNLTSAQDKVSKLLDEKQKLIEDIKRMQEQLGLNERGRQWTIKR